MWIDKLADGVLQVETLIGSRYVQPKFSQRAYLMWIFRNFQSLPQQVLRPRQQRFIDRLCQERGFVSVSALGAPDKPVIGRIEKRSLAQAEILPMRKPATSTSAAVREQSREAASA